MNDWKERLDDAYEVMRNLVQTNTEETNTFILSDERVNTYRYKNFRAIAWGFAAKESLWEINENGNVVWRVLRTQEEDSKGVLRWSYNFYGIGIKDFLRVVKDQNV